MQLLKRIQVVFVLVIFFGIGTTFAQTITTPVRTKGAVFIPKLDLYWSTVVIIEDFPTFFPLELEVHLPSPHLSINVILSPWRRSFNSQTEFTTETSFFGGLGLRYYFKGTAPEESASGLFIEPQIMYHYLRTTVDPIITNNITTTTLNELGYFVGVGYQRAIIEKLYLQGRVSVGFAETNSLQSYQVGENIMILPWVGLGFRL